MEVTFYEVEVKYPATSQVLAEYLVNHCSVERSHLIVRAEGEPIETQADADQASDGVAYETKLTTEELGGESAQEEVGDARIMSLLKELEATRNEREIDPMDAAPKG